MKSVDDCIAEIRRVNLHIEEIEKLIKLLLVNNLIDEVSFQENQDNLEMGEEITSVIKKYNLEIRKVEKIENTKILYVIAPNSIRSKDMIFLRDLFIELKSDIEPVFQFKKINGMKRKKLMEEKISYSVVDKELHIFSLRGV